MSDVVLSIDKGIVTPIVEAKIKEAVIAAMGGRDTLIEGVVGRILTQKVDATGKVGSYSSDNKYSWLDVVLTQTIQKAAEAAIKEELDKASAQIKDAIIAQLQTKKGASAAASALLGCLSGTFKHSWTSKVAISLETCSRD